MPDGAPNCWRHLVGPEGGDAPFFVRNRIDFFDIRLGAAMRAEFPHKQGYELYFYVFSGAVLAGGQAFGEGEQGLLLSDEVLTAEAASDCVMVAFLIDPRAPVTRHGTVADTRKIPPPIVIRIVKRWQGLKRFWRPG
jgi:redox-sensitive bicupin YhaK (pirin superfamily)